MFVKEKQNMAEKRKTVTLTSMNQQTWPKGKVKIKTLAKQSETGRQPDKGSKPKKGKKSKKDLEENGGETRGKYDRAVNN